MLKSESPGHAELLNVGVDIGEIAVEVGFDRILPLGELRDHRWLLRRVEARALAE